MKNQNEADHSAANPSRILVDHFINIVPAKELCSVIWVTHAQHLKNSDKTRSIRTVVRTYTIVTPQVPETRKTHTVKPMDHDVLSCTVAEETGQRFYHEIVPGSSTWI